MATTRHAVLGETLKGTRRKLGTAQKGKRALLTTDLVQIVRYLKGDAAASVRDRSLFLTGFAGGLRRSEIAAMTVESLEWTPAGVAILLSQSKTDQEGRGRRVALMRGENPSTCPVLALRAWLDCAKITRGPVYRMVDRNGKVREEALRSNSIALIVKAAVAAIGLDPRLYACHSLRAGFATQAAKNGANIFDIMRQTGHTSTATVARYIREAEVFRDSAAGRLGL